MIEPSRDERASWKDATANYVEDLEEAFQELSTDVEVYQEMIADLQLSLKKVLTEFRQFLVSHGGEKYADDTLKKFLEKE